MKETNVTVESLKAIPVPETTKSFQPVPHYELVNIIQKQVKVSNLSVISQRIDVNRFGKQMFGTLTLESNDSKKVQSMIGYRSSYDKSIAIGLCSGLHIINCLNMMFSGDYMTYRKHTIGLSIDELEGLVKQAIEILPGQRADFENRLNGYNEVTITTNTLKTITYDMMLNQVFPPSQFNNFLTCFGEEQPNYGYTLGAVHNAVTRLIRKDSLMMIADRTPKLTQVVDGYYELLAA